MLETKPTEFREYARLQLALPDHVLQTLVDIRALWNSAPTDFDDCQYCVDSLNGDISKVESCEHYDRLWDALQEIHKIENSLTKEEHDLLEQSDRLKWAAEKAWDYLRPDWRPIPEGYYAVPDPRDEVDEMTYWRRKDIGKRKRPEFAPWQPRGAKVHYGPTLFTNDPRLKNLKGDEKNWFGRAWYEEVYWPYRYAIIETVLEDPITAAQRFAEWNTRCCMCGRALTHEDSKTLGIGPECGKGIPKEVLAEHFQLQVGRLHAKSGR